MLFGTLISALVMPLSTSHWDSPIYLYQAKRFVETDLLTSYHEHSKEINVQVSEYSSSSGEGYSESFWRFMRFGNIAILGSAVKLANNEASAITLAGWLYAFFLAAGTMLVFLSICKLAVLFDVVNKESSVTADAIYAFLYIVANLLVFIRKFLERNPRTFFTISDLMYILTCITPSLG